MLHRWLTCFLLLVASATTLQAGQAVQPLEYIDDGGGFGTVVWPYPGGVDDASRRLDTIIPAAAFNQLFPNGLRFYGLWDATEIWLNSNGNISFGNPVTTFTPESFRAEADTPMIAAFFADVDTTGEPALSDDGGTSTGNGFIYGGISLVREAVYFTWNDVGSYRAQGNPPNAFQIILRKVNDEGDFNIELRYESVQWIAGELQKAPEGTDRKSVV